MDTLNDMKKNMKPDNSGSESDISEHYMDIRQSTMSVDQILDEMPPEITTGILVRFDKLTVS